VAERGRGEAGADARACAPTPPPHCCPPSASRPRVLTSRDQDIGFRGLDAERSKRWRRESETISRPRWTARPRRKPPPGGKAEAHACALARSPGPPPPAGGGGSGAVHGCAVEGCGLARLGSGGVRARARPAPPALPGKSRWRGALRGGAHACAHRCALAGPRRGLSGSKARGRLTAGSVGFAGQA
jgi:hypothetical protein